MLWLKPDSHLFLIASGFCCKRKDLKNFYNKISPNRPVPGGSRGVKFDPDFGVQKHIIFLL